MSASARADADRALPAIDVHGGLRIIPRRNGPVAGGPRRDELSYLKPAGRA